MNISQIAQICHEANKALCEAHGDFSQSPWSSAADWQKESTVNTVKFLLANPDAPVSATHDAWSAERLASGWTHGPVKDTDKKTHPALVPFDQLPSEQMAKDALFKAIVNGLRSYLQ